MANRKKNKNNRTSDPLETARDGFSEALLGIRSDVPAEASAQAGKHIESASESEISSGDEFLDRTYPENILASIAEAHPMEKQTALPEEERHLLLPEHIEQNRKRTSLPAVILVVAILFFYVIGYESSYRGNNERGGAGEDTAVASSPFSNISLEAKAAYVYDVNSGEPLFELNANNVLPLASLTKLMTAIVASELLPSGTVVTIGKTDIESEGDSGLFMDERWKLSDIIGFTLITSSNDGASALAAAAGSLGQNAYGEPADESKQMFVNAMNKKAEELGLRGTRFFNESGLDIDQEISGGYGTARDVAFLMAHGVKSAYRNIESTTLARTTVTSLDNIRHQATNTNEKIDAIPGIIASKTGYTDLAGGNLAIAFDAGLSRPVVIVVLGSTREGRFKDAEALAWAALEELKKLR